MAYDTALNIISDAAIELGLGAVSDPFASTDPNVILLRALLKSAGRAMLLEQRWLQATKEYTFTTSGASSYALPSDYVELVDGSGWNRTQRLPLTPVTPQQWQALSALNTGTSIPMLIRPRDGLLSVWPTSNTGQTYAFEYVSSYWVKATASSSPDKDAPTVNTDVIYFDAPLAVQMLRLAFLRRKGFDATEAQQEFDRLLALEKAANQSGNATLPVTPTGSFMEPNVNVISDEGAIY